MPGKYHPLTLALTMAPLYAGPLIGGWMGAPLSLLLALAALFFLGQLAAGKEKARGQMPLAAFLILLGGAQLLAVAVIFALGLGLSKITGPVDAPVWLPLVLTGLGAALFAWRYRHDPQEAEMMEAIDDAVAQIDAVTEDLERLGDGGRKPEPETRDGGPQ